MEKNLDKKKTMKILIVKIAAIGDLVLITPAVRAIRENFPQARITLLVGKWSKPIIEGNPDIEEIIEVPDNIFFRIKPFSLLSLIFKLRKKKFDLVFVWHRSLAFRFFSWLLGIKERIGFSRKGSAIFLTKYVEENPKIHEVHEYLSTLHPLGIISEEENVTVSLSKSDYAFADHLWQEKSLSDDDIVIGIAPGGGRNPKEIMPLKHWPNDYYAILSDRLIKEKKVRIFFLGDKNDLPIIEKIQAKMGEKTFNICGKTELKQAAAVISRCEVFIANDSALMHIAVAVKTPVVSIFGPTNPKELAPQKYPHIYFFAGKECSPCYKNGKFPDCKDKDCLRKISPDMVYLAVEKILP